MNNELFVLKEGLTIPYTEEVFFNVGHPAYQPFTSISANAKASFECECNITNSDLMRTLLGIDRGVNPQLALYNSICFKCETPFMVQARKHRKKRINKKWAKKYGYKYVVKPMEITDVELANRDGEIDILGRGYLR